MARSLVKTLDVGIDLDGVVYDFAASVRYWLWLSEGRPLGSMPDPTCWEFFSEQWGLSLDEFLSACDAGVDAGVIFRVGDPHPYSVATLQFLDQMGHRLHIVTDRTFGTRSQQNTAEWLADNEIPYTSLTFSADKTCVPADIFIDDRPKNYDDLKAAGGNPVLMHRPWNQDHPGRRVFGWHQFLDEVLDISLFV